MSLENDERLIPRTSVSPFDGAYDAAQETMQGTSIVIQLCLTVW